MAGRSSGPQTSRPVLTANLSSSVPTTPHQRPRHGFGSGSRSPSPRGLGGNQSPRSAFGEATGASIPASKGRSVCKYEKTPALSKRRMQYNIGDAPLDSPPNKPKKSLDPDEEKRLSGDMRELYDRLLPTKESEARRVLFIEKLERILRQEWPDHVFHVHVFGSSGNMLCTSDSDVDICIQTPMKELESMHMLAALLERSGMQNVLCIPAKVPIVKIWDPELKLAADLNVNNTLALENTRMIKTYIQMDERVRPLAMVIKHWTRMRILNDAGIGGTISSYTWICLILNFLQTREPPVLPCIQLKSRQGQDTGSAESTFDDSQESSEGFGRHNQSTIGELLFQFFRYYGYEFDYNASVVSVRQGKVLTRKEKGWTTTSKDGQWRLCVEEPFNVSRNLGNSADATSFRGIHLELRDAFINICNLKIDKFMEPYEFPPEDKQAPSIFKKAPAVPKPTLTAAPAPNGRKGSGGPRSNKHNSRGNYSGPSSRRASAGSAYGRGGQLPFSPPVPYHEFNQQVAQNWLLLHHHAAHVNKQLYGNMPMHPMQAYQLGLANAQGGSHSASSGIRENGQAMSKSQSQRTFSNSLSSEYGQGSQRVLQPSLYYNGLEQAMPLLPPKAQDGPRTNPSSPSFATTVPVRRGLQRTSIPNGSSAAAVRSQSQPARVMPQSMPMPFAMHYDPATGMPYYAVPAITGNNLQEQYAQMAALQTGNALGADQQPKEYLGYYVDTNSVQQLQGAGSVMHRVPSRTDLAQRRDRGNDKLLPLDLSGNRKPSRSPSPLGHSRQSNTPPKSAPLPAAIDVASAKQRVDPGNERSHYPPVVSSHTVDNAPRGLLIVNGSSFPEEDDSTRRYVSTVDSASTSEDTSSFAYDANDQVRTEAPARPVDQSPFVSYATSSYLDSSQVSSTIGSPLQPFPSYSESITPLMSQEEEIVTSPTRAQHSPWQSFGSPIANGLQIDTLPDAKEILKSSKTAPFLSPVIENRMPTPQMQRRIDLHNSQQASSALNGHSANGATPIIAGLPLRPAEPVPPTPASAITGIDPPAGSTTSNTWQTQPQSKRRSSNNNNNRKRSKSGPTERQSTVNGHANGTAAPPAQSIAPLAPGATTSPQDAVPATRLRIEPLPALARDRKGG